MSGYFKTMSDGSPVDTEKTRAIQYALGVLPDGKIGTHTYDAIYRKLDEPTTCYSDVFYGHKVITGLPENVNVSRETSLMVNHISGTFSYDGEPISPLIGGGIIHRTKCSHFNEKKCG